MKKLFGRIPEFFSDADDLREKWSNPETRDPFSFINFMDDKMFECFCTFVTALPQNQRGVEISCKEI